MAEKPKPTKTVVKIVADSESHHQQSVEWHSSYHTITLNYYTVDGSFDDSVIYTMKTFILLILYLI